MKKVLLFVAIGIVIGGLVYGIYFQNQQPVLALSETVLDVSITESPTARPTVLTVTIAPTRTPFQPETHTPTSSVTPTVTPTLTPSLTPTASPTPTPLEEASIQRIYGRWAAYSLDCEARSAVDWAAYLGVSINEIEFFNALPVSDDPELGFVGNVHAPWGQIPPKPYGVHAGPVASLLQEYGLNALAVRGITFDQLRAELSSGKPVIVWVVGRVGRGTPVPYTSSTGVDITVARFEHTVIVTGYTQNQVTVLDGDWVYNRSIKDFLDSWGVLGNMAVILGD